MGENRIRRLMIEHCRDPLPDEERRYRAAVATRNKEQLMELNRLYPFVMWGSITRTLTNEEQGWTFEVAQEADTAKVASF